jgi:tetratricopeptide (TPR) repeat protein
MSRDHRKHRYLPLLIGLFALVVAAVWILRPPLWLLALLAAVWLAASWLARRKYLLFFKGMALLRQQKFEAAELVFLAFLEKLQQRPAMKKGAKFWYYGAYTPNFEAMTLNNLGVAKMAQGQNDAAAHYFEQALDTDEKYAKPHHNLAALAVVRGDENAARQHFQRAAELGFDGGGFDQFLEKVRVGYAKTYG